MTMFEDAGKLRGDLMPYSADVMTYQSELIARSLHLRAQSSILRGKLMTELDQLTDINEQLEQYFSSRGSCQ